MQTKNCIICSARTYNYCGHVLKGSKKVIAGVCKKKSCYKKRDEIIIPGGYCGQWRGKYGIEPYKW
jgi:hypothetical protein